MTGPDLQMKQLRPFMPPSQKANVAKMAALLNISEGAAVALTLCREAMRDYCPPSETASVVAALVGLESRKAGPDWRFVHRILDEVPDDRT